MVAKEGAVAAGKPKEKKEKKEKSKSKDKKPKKELKKNKDGTTRKRADHTRWATYIFKVLRHLHSDMGISSKAMSVLESLCDDVIDQLGTASAELARMANGHTIGSREMLSATMLVVPGELGRRASAEGGKVFAKFMQTVKPSGSGERKGRAKKEKSAKAH